MLPLHATHRNQQVFRLSPSTFSRAALVSAIRNAEPSSRILLCAPSNGAVDECTRRLLAGMWDKAGNT